MVGSVAFMIGQTVTVALPGGDYPRGVIVAAGIDSHKPGIVYRVRTADGRTIRADADRCYAWHPIGSQRG